MANEKRRVPMCGRSGRIAGEITVALDKNPLLGISACRCVRCRWCGQTKLRAVTHIPTGGAVKDHITAEQAEKILAAVRDLDWDWWDHRNIPPALETEVPRRIRGVLSQELGDVANHKPEKKKSQEADHA